MPTTLLLLTLLVIPDGMITANLPRWFLLSLSLPWLALNLSLAGWRMSWNWPSVLLSAWLCYAWCSLLWAPSWSAGLGQWWQFVLLGIALWLGASGFSLAWSLRAFVYGMSVNGWLAAAQAWFDWTVLPSIAGQPAGTFVNQNHLATAALLAVPLAVAGRQYVTWPGLLLALWLPQSLNVWLSGLVLGLLYVWQCGRARRWVHWLAASMIAIGLVSLPQAWQWAAQYDPVRRELYQTTIAQLTWHGHGLGSFWTLFPQWTGQVTLTQTYLRQPVTAHNDLLTVASDTGLAGLLLIGAVLWIIGRAPHDAPRFVVVAFLLLGLFGFPLYQPVAATVAALCLGHCLRAGHGLRRQWQLGAVSSARGGAE